MTVDELRDLLDNVDGDLIVVMSKDGEGNGFSPLAEVEPDTRYTAESDWSGEVHHADDWPDHLLATPEWTAWTALNGKWLTQEDFAEHILDTASDVVMPSAADLLEMAETFVATKSLNFKSGSRLRNGQRQLTYVEVIDAQAGPAGNVTIPESILLRLAPFDGAEPVEMGARIRYRINDGALRLGYVLDRPDLVLRAAFAEVVAAIEGQTGITALWGTPRS